MISIERVGHYQLMETKRHIKVLYLDGQAYAWLELGELGGVLVATSRQYQPAKVIGVGDYRIYGVSGRTDMTCLPHLELSDGDERWHSYILPSQMPTAGIRHQRVRITPTREVVTDVIHRTAPVPAAPKLLLAAQS